MGENYFGYGYCYSDIFLCSASYYQDWEVLEELL